jgi:hypothetical protein
LASIYRKVAFGPALGFMLDINLTDSQDNFVAPPVVI